MGMGIWGEGLHIQAINKALLGRVLARKRAPARVRKEWRAEQHREHGVDDMCVLGFICNSMLYTDAAPFIIGCATSAYIIYNPGLRAVRPPLYPLTERDPIRVL